MKKASVSTFESGHVRHSGFRTISGGIWHGLGFFALPGLTQLLALGYQRMLNKSTLKGNLFFLNFVNIVASIMFVVQGQSGIVIG